MGFIQDISPIFKKRELSFLESYKESDDVYTFIFEKELDLDWKAGQHGIFTITHKKIKKPTRPFSVASAPFENMVKITMGISENPSEFKKAMLELKRGMTINMRGPVGPMYINDHNPTLLIAGGIGITPFRAIIKEVENSRSEPGIQLNLLYFDSKGSFVYKNELDQISENTSLLVNYLHSRDELYQEMDRFKSLYKNTGNYFLAGSRSMVNAVSTYLRTATIYQSGISKRMPLLDISK